MKIPKMKCKWVYSHKIKRSELPRIQTAGDAVAIFRQLFDEHEINLREHFYALFLNNSARVVSYEHVSCGGTDMTVVDMKMIAAPALGAMATQVVICHNHPSGKVTPSDNDKLITKQIRKGLLLLGIKLVDHIILTEDSFYSFANEAEL